jgi:hypothetical protein
MGYRALIVYERPDASYILHYSHNGALDYQLKHQITPEMPFGGDQPSEWAHDQYEALQSSTETTADAYAVDRQSQTPVNPDPIAVGVSLDEIHSEYLVCLQHEAFYVVAEDFNMTAYRNGGLGLSTTQRLSSPQRRQAMASSSPSVGGTVNPVTMSTATANSRH